MGVEVRHQRPLFHALNFRTMNVHGHINRPKRRTKNKKTRTERPRRLRKRQDRQQSDQSKTAYEDQGPCAATGRHHAGRRHRDERAEPKAQEQNAKLRFVGPDILLEEREKWGATGH